MANVSYTKKTLQALRARGNMCCIVEHFNMFANIRQDAFGFVDIIALGKSIRKPGDAIIAVQSFGTDFQEHYRKITELRRKEALRWLSCGGEIELWGWRKLKKIKADGHKGEQKVWTPRVQALTEMDFYADEGVFL